MNLESVLKTLSIPIEEIEHELILTMKDGQEIKKRLKGIECKNLFLTDKKGKYILVLSRGDKQVEIKKIEQIVYSFPLSFASELELKELLGVQKGSVSPLGILNDHENRVLLVLDIALQDQNLLLHPNVNTKTMVISYANLIRFIEYTGHSYTFYRE